MLRPLALWSVPLLLVWGAALLWHLRRECRLAHRQFAGWNLQRPASGLPRRGQAVPAGSDVPADSDGDLLWFLQVSDIHVSKFGIGEGARHLEAFLRYTVPAVNPRFVLATGDLTDAKHRRGHRSGQSEEEWRTYHELLDRYGVLGREDFWIDLRGNHDCFDVPAWDSRQNLFPPLLLHGNGPRLARYLPLTDERWASSRLMDVLTLGPPGHSTFSEPCRRARWTSCKSVSTSLHEQTLATLSSPPTIPL